MNSSKVIVICLILLMAIFFIGISLNLIDKDNDGLENSSEKEQKNAAIEYNKDSWLKSFDNLFSPFAESITFNELNFDNNCSVANNKLVLNEKSPRCKISVTGFSKPMFKKLSITPSSNNKSTKLETTYQAKGKDAEEPSNWPSNDQNNSKLSFVIFGKEEFQGKKAATISLYCKNNCSNHQQIKINFN